MKHVRFLGRSLLVLFCIFCFPYDMGYAFSSALRSVSGKLSKELTEMAVKVGREAGESSRKIITDLTTSLDSVGSRIDDSFKVSIEQANRSLSKADDAVNLANRFMDPTMKAKAQEIKNKAALQVTQLDQLNAMTKNLSQYTTLKSQLSKIDDDILRAQLLDKYGSYITDDALRVQKSNVDKLKSQLLLTDDALKKAAQDFTALGQQASDKIMASGKVASELAKKQVADSYTALTANLSADAQKAADRVKQLQNAGAPADVIAKAQVIARGYQDALPVLKALSEAAPEAKRLETLKQAYDRLTPDQKLLIDAVGGSYKDDVNKIGSQATLIQTNKDAYTALSSKIKSNENDLQQLDAKWKLDQQSKLIAPPPPTTIVAKAIPEKEVITQLTTPLEKPQVVAEKIEQTLQKTDDQAAIAAKAAQEAALKVKQEAATLPVLDALEKAVKEAADGLEAKSKKIDDMVAREAKFQAEQTARKAAQDADFARKALADAAAQAKKAAADVDAARVKQAAEQAAAKAKQEAADAARKALEDAAAGAKKQADELEKKMLAELAQVPSAGVVVKSFEAPVPRDILPAQPVAQKIEQVVPEVKPQPAKPTPTPRPTDVPPTRPTSKLKDEVQPQKAIAEVAPQPQKVVVETLPPPQMAEVRIVQAAPEITSVAKSTKVAAELSEIKKKPTVPEKPKAPEVPPKPVRVDVSDDIKRTQEKLEEGIKKPETQEDIRKLIAEEKPLSQRTKAEIVEALKKKEVQEDIVRNQIIKNKFNWIPLLIAAVAIPTLALVAFLLFRDKDKDAKAVANATLPPGVIPPGTPVPIPVGPQPVPEPSPYPSPEPTEPYPFPDFPEVPQPELPEFPTEPTPEYPEIPTDSYPYPTGPEIPTTPYEPSYPSMPTDGGGYGGYTPSTTDGGSYGTGSLPGMADTGGYGTGYTPSDTGYGTTGGYGSGGLSGPGLSPYDSGSGSSGGLAGLPDAYRANVEGYDAQHPGALEGAAGIPGGSEELASRAIAEDALGGPLTAQQDDYGNALKEELDTLMPGSGWSNVNLVPYKLKPLELPKRERKIKPEACPVR